MNMAIHEKGISRRLFLRVIGWGSFFITLGMSIIGTIRFLFPRVLFEQPSTFKIGFPEDFKINGEPDKHGVFQVYEKWKKEQSVWIVREKNRIYAIYAKCTHLGCTPNYFAEDRVFKCPCHGSQFYSNGINFAGPATRPLDRFKISISEDGQILIDKSKVYTFKEFDKPGAYLKV
jgi:cytochrome b6-f complex iron-sulfur subunit